MAKIKVTITSRRGIMHLAKNARGREKSVEEVLLAEAMDPMGRNMLYCSEDLLDGTIRTQWFVQLKDTKEPEPIWLDIDIEKLQEVSTIVEIEATPGQKIPKTFKGA